MKAKTPIEMALDGVEWIPIEKTNRPHSEEIAALPHVTHVGELSIADGLALTVVQLSDGNRVIPEHELVKFFRFLNGGR